MHANIAPRVRPLMVCWMMSSDQCMRALFAAIAEAGAGVHWVRPTRIFVCQEKSRKAAHSRTWSCFPDLAPIWPRFDLEPPKALIEFGPFVNRDIPPRGNGLIPARPLASTLLQDLFKLVLAADGSVSLDHLEAGHDIHGGIAVGIKAPLAVEAIEILGGGDGSSDLLTVFCVGALDCINDHLSGLPGVEGVRGRFDLVAVLVELVDFCALSGHLLKGLAGERDAHINAQGGITRCRLEQLLLEETIGAHEADLGCQHPKILHLSDDHLGAGLNHGTHVDEVGTGRPDLREHRLLVGLLIIDALVA